MVLLILIFNSGSKAHVDGHLRRSIFSGLSGVVCNMAKWSDYSEYDAI